MWGINRRVPGRLPAIILVLVIIVAGIASIATAADTTGFMINSSADEWSKIMPLGNNTYPENTNQTFIAQAKPGSTMVNLQVDDEDPKGPIDNYTFVYLDDNHTIQAEGAPKDGQIFASFNGNPRYGDRPLPVQFHDTSRGTPISWFWNFGDGVNNTTKNPEHTYTVPGIYTVTLWVANNYSSGTGQWKDFVTVTNEPVPVPTPTPVPGEISVNFTMNPAYGVAPVPVQFMDKSSGNPTSWFWDFGDRSQSIHQNPAHLYTVPGTYSVTLLARNSNYSGSLTKTNEIIIR